MAVTLLTNPAALLRLFQLKCKSNESQFRRVFQLKFDALCDIQKRINFYISIG